MPKTTRAKAQPSASGRQRCNRDERFIVLTMPEEKVYGERTRGRTLDCAIICSEMGTQRCAAGETSRQAPRCEANAKGMPTRPMPLAAAQSRFCAFDRGRKKRQP